MFIILLVALIVFVAISIVLLSIALNDKNRNSEWSFSLKNGIKRNRD